MEASDAALELIKEFEGFRPRPYKDTGDHWTIGFGHQIRDNEVYIILTEAQAEKLLKVDLVVAENAVNRWVCSILNQGQFDALVDFTFNLGAGTFKNSTLLKRLNEGNYKAAADNFQKWVYSNGIAQKGLMRRRAAEWQMFTQGMNL